MKGEEEIEKLKEKLEELKKAEKEVEESFSHVPDVQRQILMNLRAQEGFLLELIEKKSKEG